MVANVSVRSVSRGVKELKPAVQKTDRSAGSIKQTGQLGPGQQEEIAMGGVGVTQGGGPVKGGGE